MSNSTIRIVFNGHEVTAASGTKICELLTRVKHPGELQPIGAIANCRLTGLYRTLTADAQVNTLDYNSKHGAYIFRRSACLLMLAVVKELYPRVKVEIGQSIGEGYFVEMAGMKVTRLIVEKIQRRIDECIAKDLPFLIEQTFVDEAATYFDSVGAVSKVRFLTQIPRSEVRLVSIMDFKDILHGPVCMSTGVLANFFVQKYRNGILIDFPNRDGSRREPVDENKDRLLYESFTETREWNELVGIRNVSDLNEACINGTVSDLIKVAESLHEKKIARIADMITNRRRLPRVVLMAGPSASGKTTTSQKLGVHLRVNGIRLRTLSMDNYYVDREKTPKHPDGTYNFESPYAIDLKLFGEQLARLIAGEQVDTPVFSFSTGKRSKKINPMQLEKRDVLIIEGIHALNDLLHGTVDKGDKFGIFVSGLTQLTIDEHNRIFTSDSRLLRRMVRDRLYRGYSAAQSIAGWLSVRAGEDNYIFPYQDNADVMFNSTLVYEHAVLKTYAKRFLLEVKREDPAFTESERLYHFLENFITILPEEVPPTSVLREFIGGSTFSY